MASLNTRSTVYTPSVYTYSALSLFSAWVLYATYKKFHPRSLSSAPSSTSSPCTSHSAAQSPSPVESVRPGINDRFLSSSIPIPQHEEKFETSEREIFVKAQEIITGLNAFIRPGCTVCDLGAGTGVFMEIISRQVGSTGALNCLDISKQFVEHLELRKAALLKSAGAECVYGCINVGLCGPTELYLPDASQDVVFTADTYHHFEYPTPTLTAIHRALKPNGILVIVDFERIEGVSSEWTLGHVRASQELVIQEILQTGLFVLEKQLKNEIGLQENYCCVFRAIPSSSSPLPPLDFLSSKPITLSGACHCKRVRFTATLPLGLLSARRCNCSLCRMRGAVAVTSSASNFSILSGADSLTLYQFNTRTAKHWFCSVCGIYTHHQRRSNTEQYGVNAACLEGVSPFDFREVPVGNGVEHPSDHEGDMKMLGTLKFIPAQEQTVNAGTGFNLKNK